MEPLVSVNVVTYNHKDYIIECLEGILMQKTNFAFEIILGEDESTDGTREICKEYANRYPEKIKLYLRSRKDVIYINGKPTGRYNMIQCLKASKGKYIALCEGDDYWTDPLKLQNQVDFLEENPNINLCFTNTEILSNNKIKKQHVKPEFLNKPLSYKVLLANNNFIVTASVLFRNLNGLEFPDWFYKLPYGDMGLYKLLSNGKSIYGLLDTTAVYRVHNKGLYSGVNKLNSRKNYYRFYKLIWSHLNKEEQQASKLKMEQLLDEIGMLRFKNKPSSIRVLYKYAFKAGLFS